MRSSWDDRDNNKAFLAQTVVMTTNPTLSIPNALQAERPDDYYKNTVTIAWPDGADGQPLAIWTASLRAVVFKDGGNVATAKEFVALSRSRGLARALSRLLRRALAAADAELLEQPFWLDPSDPHRMRCGHAVPDPPARLTNYAVGLRRRAIRPCS